jgi:predicted MFS family arabinose efflux permease
MQNPHAENRRTLRALEWLNFFLVQTGVGPFLAAYLAASGWNPASVGYALMFGGLITVAMQVPAGAAVDAIHRKRMLLVISLSVLATAAILLMHTSSTSSVYLAEVLMCGAAPFLGPTVAAITLGIVGADRFDRQFGRNKAFDSAGNVVLCSLIAVLSYQFGNKAIFVTTLLMAIPTLLCILSIDGSQIDYARARGGRNGSSKHGVASLLKDRVLIVFFCAVFLFHLANAAMLPQLGEMLSKDNIKSAAPFMSACIIVTQVVVAISASWVGRRAAQWGRKPLLMMGFGVLPLRGVLYTLTHSASALIAIQILDGVAACIFGVVAMLVVADRARGTGHFNLAAGGLATMVGIGASLSNAIGGALIQHAGYATSFRGLAGIAVVAFVILWLAVPETLVGHQEEPLPCIPEHPNMSQATTLSPFEERSTV